MSISTNWAEFNVVGPITANHMSVGSFETTRDVTRQRREPLRSRELSRIITARLAARGIDFDDSRFYIDPGLVIVTAPTTSGKTAWVQKVKSDLDKAGFSVSYDEMGEPETAKPFPITDADMNRWLLKLRYGHPIFEHSSSPHKVFFGTAAPWDIDGSFDKQAAIFKRLQSDSAQNACFDYSDDVGEDVAGQVWIVDSISLAYASSMVSRLGYTSGGFPTGLAEFCYNRIHCVLKKRGVVGLFVMNPLMFESARIEALQGHITGIVRMKTLPEHERRELDNRIARGEQPPFDVDCKFNITTDTDIMWRPRTSGFSDAVPNAADISRDFVRYNSNDFSDI